MITWPRIRSKSAVCMIPTTIGTRITTVVTVLSAVGHTLLDLLFKKESHTCVANTALPR